MPVLPSLPNRPKPVVLTILDGWGCRDGGADNAIANAQTPNWNHLRDHFPMGTLSASAHDVGLPDGQMGNSEVGHMNIGSGRVILQDLPRIDDAITHRRIPDMPAFRSFVSALQASGGTCHLLGLLSPGGVHSHDRHIAALALMLAEQGIKVQVHAFLDGRDTPPRSAKGYMQAFTAAIAPAAHLVSVATVSGRYYAMDRDKRWDRVQKAYDALVDAKGEHAPDAQSAIDASYAADKSDEFVLPTAIGDYAGMRDGDGLLMANFRADRARQLLTALVDDRFGGFTPSRRPDFAARMGMVEYSSDLAPFLTTLFGSDAITDTLGEAVSQAGMTQLRIAETEKYAHVTFFFNAGAETEFAGESRILVPSPKVATYDLQPEMSAYEVVEKLEDAIANDRFDLIVVNFANPDMVGHTGNMQACVKAVETVDTCLGRLAKAVLPKGGVLLVTADHGNIEQLEDAQTQQAHTAHTLSLVPFIAAAQPWEGHPTRLPQGKLSDVAPTVLQLLGIAQPAAMTGTSRLAGLLEPAHA
jgi:2,3-bisphosphoglycerate-independent phosphoglycerate mutase